VKAVRYSDFIVRIGPPQQGTHRVSARFRGGDESGDFTVPLTPREIAEATWLGLGSRRRDIRPAAGRPGLRPREVGDRLFAALFSGPVGDFFKRSLEESAGDLGLRLRIEVDTAGTTSLDLPWELLRWTDRGEFLALSRWSPIVRSPVVPRSIPRRQRQRIEPPLRILAAMANPASSAELDLTSEWAALQKACGAISNVELERVQDATPAGIGSALRGSQPFHVLHFMGHGRFDAETGDGGLMLAEDREPTRGASLAQILHDFPSLRLAVLNACHTARSTSGKGFDPFAGAAMALVRNGLRAVVGMQAPISDDAAICFSGAFYTALAHGEPIDTAMSEARKAVYEIDTEGSEWATPVLFLRGQNGRLFDAGRQKSVLLPKPPRDLDPLAANPALATLLTPLHEPGWRDSLRQALGRMSVHLQRPQRIGVVLDLLSSTDSLGVLLPRAAEQLAEALPDLAAVPASVLEAAAASLIAARAEHRHSGIPPAFLRSVERAFARLAGSGPTPPVDRALRKALTGDSDEICLAAAHLLHIAGRDTAELTAALAASLPRDAEEEGWPIDAALREIAARRPDLLPSLPGTFRHGLRRNASWLQVFQGDPCWRRIGLALYGDWRGPDGMFRESPLTSRLRAALDAGRTGRALTGDLRKALSEPAEKLQADALLALAASGEPVTAELSGSDPAARRARAQLSRLAADLKAAVPPAAAPAVRALATAASHLPANRWQELMIATLEVARAFGDPPLPILALAEAAPLAARPRALAEVWRSVLAGTHGDPVYNLAVLLDTAGEVLASSPLLLAQTLTMIPASAAPAWSRGRLAARPRNEVELLAGALDSLDGLSPAFDFVRGWALVILAPSLREAGLAPEAEALALGGLSDRFGARADALRALAVSTSPTTETLLAEALGLGDPFFRVRALLRLARTWPGLRERLLAVPPTTGWTRWTRWLRPGGSGSTLAREALKLPDPAHRFWACEELAAIDLDRQALWSSRALRAARRISDPEDRAIGEDPGLAAPALLAAGDALGKQADPLVLGAIVHDLRRELGLFPRREDPEPALVLAERHGLTARTLPEILDLLEFSDDRLRYRAALTLHGDLSPGVPPLSAARLGQGALEELARRWLVLKDRAPGAAKVIGWTFERVEHDDGDALGAWAQSLAGGGSDARVAEVILGSIERLHPVAEPAFRHLIETGSPPVQRALLRALCRLLARGRVRDELWNQIFPSLANLGPEAGADVFLADPPASLVDALLDAWDSSDGIADQVPTIADRVLSASTSPLAEALHRPALREHLKSAGLASRPASPQLRAAADRLTPRPELLPALLSWLCTRLGRDVQDGDPFCPLSSDLLALAAAVAERLPDVYRAAARGLPELPLRLSDAARLHDSFPGRRAALRLLAASGSLTRHAWDALESGLVDVPPVQTVALSSLALYREADDETLQRLIQGFGTFAPLIAVAAGRLLALFARRGILTPKEREVALRTLAENATRGSRSDVCTLSPQPPLRLESLGSLDDLLYDSLAEAAGLTGLLEEP
jgi:hypothetical protein